ncbi:hypothetical protein [Rhizobium halophytocola]|uniref:Helix-turn-helix domain-containing protein n=1 Tax=Rhizobium halophytocola TaxID=735519 RepID=A0ABS4E422_9HYPH|nr:hypothetical protein [Rhizobium halophytocola]MBP1852704.1 hypothetical protein [Rhizobium halophytocola]
MISNAIKVPAHIQPYTDVLGIALGVDFLLAFGGTPVYLSEHPQERSPVLQLVGKEKTIELAKRIHVGGVTVPTGKPFIAEYLRYKGLTNIAIARRLHVTETTVRNWLGRQVDAQLDLFG